ncbi:MAG TPA: serine/threonine-protein kinase [Anaerolineae bacterium]|nr:serine/threonine-protein kinase [Anaerolineae bacterium]
MLNSDQILANRYRLILLVGQGTMGAVYDAEDLRFNRRVALKRLRYPPEANEHITEQTRAQFEREARILATLRHPNLPRVTDYFTFSDQEFLVMDYIEGQALDTIMTLHPGGLDEPTVLDWADQLLSALEYIHQHGLVHRDVKPANVRVTPEGQVFLVDFGLVKVFDPASPKTATAVRGLGTPQYAPPEQYDAELGHTEPRSDLYALGATMYHLLTGEPPATVTRRVSNPGAFRTLREIKPTISPEVERAILRAMEVPIAKRFASASDMRSALKLARAHSTLNPVDTSQLPAAELIELRRKNRRRRLLGIATGLLILLVMCVTAFAVAAPGLVLTPTVTPTSTATSAIPAVLPTDTMTRTPTPTPTFTPTDTATATFTPSATATATTTATPTPTPSATLRRLTPTPTSTLVINPSFTNTPERGGPKPRTSTPTPLPIPPTHTHTPVPAPTDTPTRGIP